MAATKRRAKKPPRARLDVDERRAQLLALGLDLFSQRAYDAISIDEIALAAGISKGLLYHYFPTKRDFYSAAIREASRQLLECTRPDESAPPLERLSRGLDAYLAYVEHRGPAYSALLRGGIGSDPSVAGIVQETRDSFLERVIENFPAAEIGPTLRVVLRGWIGFVEAASLDWVERRELSREELRELCADVLMGAITVATRRQGER
jgi:AcrR family transcriptional regulator